MVLELASGLASTEADRLLQAESLVRSYCGWHIAPSRPGTMMIPRAHSIEVLPSLHVTAVTTVTAWGDSVDVSDYLWSEDGVFTWHDRYYCRVRQDVVIDFVHGYETPPAEITAVVQSIAQRAVQNPGSLVRMQAGPFADSYSQTGANQSLPIALLDAEKAILDRYKLPPRP